MVVRLAHREHRSVLELGPEPRHGLGQVRRGQHGSDARHGHGRRGVDGVDPEARVVDRHELDVQLAVEVDVGDVRLAAGDPVEAADPGRGPADAVAHGAAPSAARCTASMICS